MFFVKLKILILFKTMSIEPPYEEIFFLNIYIFFPFIKMNVIIKSVQQKDQSQSCVIFYIVFLF